KMDDERNPYERLTTQDLLDYLKTCQGKQPEGNFLYSNFGMGLLGYILGLKTGLAYEEAVQRELLQPLEMKNTFVTPDSSKAHYIVQGYDAAGNPNPVWIDTVLTGAGSFLSNASDMLLFIQAHLEEHSPLYSSLSKTYKQQTVKDSRLGWISPDGLDQFLGLGHVVWHNGMAGGYSSYIALDTVNSNGIILLFNK